MYNIIYIAEIINTSKHFVSYLIFIPLKYQYDENVIRWHVVSIRKLRQGFLLQRWHLPTSLNLHDKIYLARIRTFIQLYQISTNEFTYGYHVTHHTLLTKLIYTTGNSFCWPSCWNVSIVLSVRGPLRV
jgi:hypothetical protein